MPDARLEYPVGTRVLLLAGHPWEGATGTVVGHEKLGMCPSLGHVPRIRLDPADDVPPRQHVYATDPAHLRRL